MTLFRTTCPQCDEVEVPSEGIVFSILEANERGGPRGGYGFVCPGCGEPVWKGGRDRSGVFTLLLGAGLEPVQEAAERILREAAPRSSGRRERRRLF